jgi:hypothetical protein
VSYEKYDHGPLLRFEISWANGHVEYIDAHQALMPFDSPLLGGQDTVKRWTFHGEIDGRWQLLLTAPEADIRMVRNVTNTCDEVQP